MIEKIKAVIWDMGGVILRSMDWKPRAQLASDYHLTLDEIHQLVFNSESAQLATIGKMDIDTHWKMTGETLHIEGEELLSFRERFFEGDQIDQELIDFIRGLKTKWTTALLSNAWSDARDNLTTKKPCIDAFDISVFSCEVGMAKPDFAIYTHILQLCKVKPGEAIFVDDAVENITAANQLGIHGVRFLDSQQAKRDVEKLLAENV